MRQKKVKEATLENLISLGVLTSPDQFKMNKADNVTLEVGSGKGKFITSLANDFPDQTFIAVERDINVCYRLAFKRQELKLNNLIIIMDDALKLYEYLKDIKVDLIQLNFSDPWPKKKHHKRRLTYPSMLNIFKQFLKNNGKIILRTDHVDLFNDSFQYFNESGFKIIECNWDLEASNYMTEYEVKKRQFGPIYQLVAEQIYDQSL
ncbi:tRNA (guanosine(46)-N7)-methyltransferase TrmB [Acholeplasma granularum]|uniref:tRNA (guanosine(46)-N7)-methyltransferase TrmB n=1 Tax=Acholeplasma granularum TaxID=264635 RepID=UPI00047232C3|nr:tRNA (guanosine(46)-N7)-methyltransferase TrmB [Acholeplasma granularum]